MRGAIARLVCRARGHAWLCFPFGDPSLRVCRRCDARGRVRVEGEPAQVEAEAAPGPAQPAPGAGSRRPG
jgi:hypothetical protein